MPEITGTEIAGVITASEVQATVDAIAAWQLPNGMIPWYPGGHADPWNHVEAAMALALGGRVAEAERAYDWLVGLQRPDGSWHQYYVEDGILVITSPEGAEGGMGAERARPSRRLEEIEKAERGELTLEEMQDLAQKPELIDEIRKAVKALDDPPPVGGTGGGFQ